LAIAAGAIAKIATDVALLAQTEVAEVREAAGGGSSTMPHKRNPVSSVLAVSCARGAAAASGVLTGSLVQEHQRAAGAWHAEWDALTSALLYAGGAAAAGLSALEGLDVFPARMQENVDRAGGIVLAEGVSFALGDRIGPAAARALVGELSVRAAERGTSLRDELVADPRVIEALGPDALAAALDPAASLGATGELIDRALARHAAAGAANL